jgi:hypothetical protein
MFADAGKQGQRGRGGGKRRRRIGKKLAAIRFAADSLYLSQLAVASVCLCVRKRGFKNLTAHSSSLKARMEET